MIVVRLDLRKACEQLGIDPNADTVEFPIRSVDKNYDGTPRIGPYCPICGYNQQDAAFNMDHHTCEVKGGMTFK